MPPIVKYVVEFNKAIRPTGTAYEFSADQLSLVKAEVKKAALTPGEFIVKSQTALPPELKCPEGSVPVWDSISNKWICQRAAS